MRSALLWALLVSGMARAAEPAGGLPAGPLGARVGEWVTYRLDVGGGRASYWRMAVVGEERDNRGRDAVWIEMELGQGQELVAPLAQWRMLVARSAGLGVDGVTRLQVAQGVDRPREVSPEAIAAFFPRLPGAVAPSNPALKGPVRVRSGAPARLMTEAGTLAAQPIELVLGDRVARRLWLSPEVPVLGLARLEMPGLGQTMELVAHGLDAKPRLPAPMPQAPQILMER